jgi:hypothetical protein
MAPLLFTGTVRSTSPPRMSGRNDEVSYERGLMRTSNGAEWNYDNAGQPTLFRWGGVQAAYEWEGGRLVRTLGEGFVTSIEYGRNGLPARHVHRDLRAGTVSTSSSLFCDGFPELNRDLPLSLRWSALGHSQWCIGGVLKRRTIDNCTR